MTSQVIFERAVQHHLPGVFVTQLAKSDEFDIGQVLLYHHKKWYQVFQKKELDYTGVPLETLLANEEVNSQFKVEVEKTQLFSATSDQSTRKVDIDLNLDADVKVAFINLGGKVDGKGTKKVTLTVSLGAVNHTRANAFQALYGKNYVLDLNHPVVKDAQARGGALFVISSIYISDKAEIKISEDESVQAETKDGESTSTSATTSTTTTGATTTTTGATTTTASSTSGTTTTGTTAATGTTTSTTGTSTTASSSGGVAGAVEQAIATAEDVVKKDVQETGDAQVGGDVSTTGITVTNRDVPTVIGFNVLKIDITKTGVLMPTDRSGFTTHHKVHYPYADTFFTTTSPKTTENEATSQSTTSEGGATAKSTSEGGATAKSTSEGGATTSEGGPTTKDTSEGGATKKEDNAKGNETGAATTDEKKEDPKEDKEATSGSKEGETGDQ